MEIGASYWFFSFIFFNKNKEIIGRAAAGAEWGCYFNKILYGLIQIREESDISVEVVSLSLLWSLQERKRIINGKSLIYFLLPRLEK